MAQTTVLRITHSKDSAALGNVNRLKGMGTATHQHELCNALSALFARIAAGLELGVSIDVLLGGTQSAPATGTLTIAGGTGAVGGTIAGTAKTVTWATSDTASATALAAAINADATLNKLVTATSAAGVVTLTSKAEATVASQITLVASGTGVTAGGLTGGKLTGGAGEDVATVTYNRS